MPILMEYEPSEASDLLTSGSTDAQLDDFLAMVKHADQSALLLDFDGTLAPFRIDPAKVRPWAGVTTLLDNIQQTGRTRIAIISGRSAPDVVQQLDMLRPPEIWGLHGAERLRSNGRMEIQDVLPQQRKALDAAKQSLQAAGLIGSTGLRLEEKLNAIAIHWRGKPEHFASVARKRVSDVFSPFVETTGIKLLQFDGGIELRAGRNKGDAVQLLLAELPTNAPVAFMGDDITDEDAFRALAGRGLSILARREWRPTVAQVWLKPPIQLRKFLSAWLRALRR